MLGYTLEDIKLAFVEGSHNNKDFKQHTEPQHLPVCSLWKAGADAVLLLVNVFPTTWAHIAPAVCRL